MLGRISRKLAHTAAGLMRVHAPDLYETLLNNQTIRRVYQFLIRKKVAPIIFPEPTIPIITEAEAATLPTALARAVAAWPLGKRVHEP
jgi:hypothetical protein